MENKILLKRNYIVSSKKSKNSAYLAGMLYNKFGILVDKPHLLSEQNIKYISQFYHANIPDGFYKHPQHLKYFTTEELVIEQLISYLQILINGEESLDSEVFKRVEIFKKALPEYAQGDDFKIRNYKVITAEEKAEVLTQISNNLSLYTRPWAIDELAEFKWLHLNGYYNNSPLLCKDNIISLFLEYKNVNFAKMLDYKDIVKMSIKVFGDKKIIDIDDNNKTIFSIAIKNAKPCPMSIKQAKYFNSIVKNINLDFDLLNNDNSPYKKAIYFMKNSKVLDAANEYNKYGALFERNLVFLLSRANLDEANKIIDMIKFDKPIVLIQLLLGIVNDTYINPRTFSFSNNNLLKSHTETQDEFRYRKSRLSVGMKQFLIEKLQEKIKLYYSQKNLGSIYISDAFKKIAPPLNTSCMGMGLDVLPVGSRMPIKCDYIRTFCFWKKAFDIDTSVLFVKNDNSVVKSFWGNFSQKLFGDSALSSGDNRSKDGAEFYDFKIKELKNLGFKQGVYVLNGYGSTLDRGEIYCGYQNKSNLETTAWDPKNIELKIHVKGASRAYMGFALDFETNEIVILNQVLNNEQRVADERLINNVEIYLNKNYLEMFNMHNLLSYCGEVVEKQEDADIVFDENYVSETGQKVISPYNIEELVNILK